MQLEYMFIIVAVFIISSGVGKIYSNKFYKKTYEQYKEEGETFFDCMCRVFNDVFMWQVRKNLGIDSFYNSKAFRVMNVVRGIIRIIIGLALIVALIIIYHTQYKVFLGIKL